MTCTWTPYKETWLTSCGEVVDYAPDPEYCPLCGDPMQGPDAEGWDPEDVDCHALEDR